MRSALVTGGAQRIGRQIVLDLAAAGWAVAIHCNDSMAAAEGLAAEIAGNGGRAAVVRGDLGHPDVPERLVAEAGTALGPLTCLVNNASRFEPDEVGSISLTSWSRHLDPNLRAPVFLAQAFAAQMPKSGDGSIVNIVDQRVLKLTPKFFSYTASKAALWTVTQTLAQALAPHIRVNAIGPGPALPTIRMEGEDFATQCRNTLLGRGTSPKEIGAAVIFLLSQPAITGQMLLLDGGQHLVWETADVTAVRE